MKKIQALMTGLAIICGVLPGAVVEVSAVSYSYTPLNFPGARGTEIHGINNDGTVVGMYYSRRVHGFVYDGTSYVTLDVSFEGATRTEAYGISNRNRIVGWCKGAGSESPGFVYDGITYAPVRFPGASFTQPYRINDAGMIAGSYDGSTGFVFDGNDYTSVSFPGATQTEVFGISNDGKVVGSYVDAASERHGFLYDGKSYTPLDVSLPDASRTKVYGINKAGQLVGSYVDSSTRPRGFVYDGNEYTTINFPGSYLTVAAGINDSGTIAGFYWDTKYRVHGFFATPVPDSRTVGSELKDVFLPEVPGIEVQTWIENLQIPWSLVFLPGGRALVSERPGRIRLIMNGRLIDDPYAEVDVAGIGEGGLMGLALHPDFPRQPYLYAMHTYRKGFKVYNRVIRLKDSGEKGVFDRIIIDKIPGARFHNGGRIAFGPDGMLYITTGENFDADLAQDLKTTAGKILRITPDGKVPKDNPFKDSPILSYGHRNPQGISWHPLSGALFSSEHGPSGEFGRFAHDEINVITKGGNYGWPVAIGAEGKKDSIDPIIVWKETTPPSGITFYQGDLLKKVKNNLFVATLKSQALVRVVINEENKPERIERWFSSDYGKGKYGRIRDVVEGPDGALYFLTNNRDGRGRPKPGDDRIYRIVPKE